MDLSDLRVNYRLNNLEKKDLQESPFLMLEGWMKEAIDEEVPEPNAMSLATASSDGRPSSRTVLLKYFDERGLVFFTNYKSRKSEELADNPFASLLFLWIEQHRQVIVEGEISKISKEESGEYFSSRPRASQIAAWASEQGAEIESRKELEESFLKAEKRFEGKGVPLPENWGGFRLNPSSFEFWQGRPDRLHDRFIYSKSGDEWTTSRLSP